MYFGLFSIFVIKPIQPDCDKIKGISVLLLETPLTRSKYFSPYTHAQRLTRTSITFCTFACEQTLQSHALNKLRLIRQGVEEPIVNYNQRYQNLVERVEGCQLDSIRSTVAMELYLGSIIEPIRKSIRNTLYFNSKHASKTLGEAMQKAQDLHIKHLYVIGEDQDSVANGSDVLPEITVNEVTSREDRGWYRNKRDFREHSQTSREMSPQRREY